MKIYTCLQESFIIFLKYKQLSSLTKSMMVPESSTSFAAENLSCGINTRIFLASESLYYSHLSAAFIWFLSNIILPGQLRVICLSSRIFQLSCVSFPWMPGCLFSFPVSGLHLFFLSITLFFFFPCVVVYPFSYSCTVCCHIFANWR